MKVLVAQKFDRDPSGGHAGNRIRLAGALARLGVEADTFFGSDLARCPARLRDRLFALALPGRVRRGNYDVVDVSACSSWWLGLRRRRSFALVESVLGAEPMYYQRWKKETAKGGYRVLVPRFRPWYPYVQLPLVARAWKGADHVLCQAEDNREFLIAEGYAPAEKVSAIGSGVDEVFLGVRRVERPVRRLLWVASWLVMKGFRYLVEGFDLAARRFPELELTVIGGYPPNDHPAGYFSPKARARVRVPETVPRERMSALYAEHDALLVTSLSEGYANVTLEAMAAAMPVITTRVGCAYDLMRDGENGLLVPPADGRAVGEAIERLVAEPGLAARLGLRARQTARDHTVAIETGRILALYERLAAERRAKRP